MLDKEQVFREIGQKVRQLRLERNLSLMGLSDLADMERSNIVRLEKGKQGITVATLVKIANALDVSLHELLP